MRNLWCALVAGAALSFAISASSVAQPLSFQRAHIATFDTKAAAEAATVNSGTLIIRTRGYATEGDNGGATYMALSSCPGTLKVSHIQTANGRCFVLDTRNATLEMFGANGNGTAGAGGSGFDNTTAFQAAAEAWSTAALNIQTLSARAGAVYWWALSGSPTAFLLDNVSGKTFEGNGAVFSARFSTTGPRPTLFLVQNNACDNIIRGFKGEQPNYLTTSSLLAGVSWAFEKNGACRNTYDFYADGGIQGYVADTGGGSARVRHADIRVETKDIYYPVAFQGQCDDCRARVIADNPGRPSTFYNVRNTDMQVRYKNARSQFTIGVSGGLAGTDNATTGFRLKLVDLGSNYSGEAGSCLYVQPTQDGSSSTNYPIMIQGEVEIYQYVQASGGGPNCIVQMRSFRHDGSTSTIVGDVAGSEIDLVVKGAVYGNLAGSTESAFSIGESSKGFSSNTRIRYTLSNFDAQSLTRPISIGQYADVGLTSTNAPSAAVAFASSYGGNFYQKNSRTATFGEAETSIQSAGQADTFVRRGDAVAEDFYTSGGAYTGGIQTSTPGINLRSPNGATQLEVRDGYVNIPNQLRIAGTPSSGSGSGITSIFSAQTTSTQAITEARGTWVKVAFSTENYDPSNVFDATTNYRYTPGAGPVVINYGVTVGPTNLASGDLVNMIIYKNGSLMDGQWQHRKMVTAAEATGGESQRLRQTMVDVASAGDYYEVFIAIGNGAGDTILSGYMSGYRLN